MATTSNDETLVMSVERAGRLLGVSRTTAYLLIKNRRLPALRLGRKLVVPKAALEKMLAEVGSTNVEETDPKRGGGRTRN